MVNHRYVSMCFNYKHNIAANHIACQYFGTFGRKIFMKKIHDKNVFFDD